MTSSAARRSCHPGRRAAARLAWAFALLVPVLLVAPLVSANPVDPSWIPGLYDDADFDDVALTVASADGWLGPATLSLAPPLTPARPMLVVAPGGAPGRAARPSLEIRAPPA